MADIVRNPVEAFDDDTTLLRLMEEAAEREGAMLIARFQISPEADMHALDALCRKQIRRRFRSNALTMVGKRVLRMAACFLLTVMLLGGMILFFSSEARATMLRWITRRQEDAVTYSSAEQYHEEDFLRFEIKKIPEGFQKQPLTEIPGIELYLDDSGNQLFFLYQPPDGRGTLYIIPGEDEIKHVDVNGILADLYVAAKEDSESNLVWTDPDTGYLLMVKGEFTEHVLVEIAESVTLAEE